MDESINEYTALKMNYLIFENLNEFKPFILLKQYPMSTDFVIIWQVRKKWIFKRRLSEQLRMAEPR